MTPYDTRFAAIKNSLLEVMESLAAPYDVQVEEYVGDDLGYTFAFERSDGDLISVTALLEDAADNGFDGYGNIVIRVLDQEDTLYLLAPDNLSDDVFADFGDDAAWDAKLAAIQGGTTAVRKTVSTWMSEVSAGIAP